MSSHQGHPTVSDPTISKPDVSSPADRDACSRINGLSTKPVAPEPSTSPLTISMSCPEG